MGKYKREPRAPAGLPATIEEVEALTYARDFIMQLHTNGGDVGSPFEGAESCHFLRKHLRLSLGFAEGRMWLTDMARAGDEESQAVLRDAIVEMKSRHIELPTELEYYNMQLVRGDIVPVKWGGPKKKNEFTRNICIAMTVAVVRDRFELKPTGRSARRRSACSIVAEALDVIHQRMDYKAVERIWSALAHNVPPGLGWVA
jgi:hypothetical protein